MSRQIDRIIKTTEPEHLNGENERIKFNYPIEIAAIHRGERCLKASRPTHGYHASNRDK